jgi:disulfide bond formation protein DsbB
MGQWDTGQTVGYWSVALETVKLQEMAENLQRSGMNDLLPYAAWLTALVATAGSLFFSEVMDLPPCILCWYQRIAMYPLVLVIGAGIVMRDAKWKYYALPLSLTGLAIAIYHNLLYYNLIPESITPCKEGISCTTVQIEWLGFITIPLMSLTAFVIVSIVSVLYRPNRSSY